MPLDRPVLGEVEERALPDAPALTVEGRRLRGVIPYGVESRDLGGFREVMSAGCLAHTDMSSLVATLNHDVSRLLGRHPTTLEVEDRSDGLHWSCDLPDSPTGQDVRAGVSRGDWNAASWRMVVGRDHWVGDVRHVDEVRELRDVAVVTNASYSAARAELRAAPQEPVPAPEPTTPPEQEEQEATVPEENEGGGLRVEDRAAVTAATAEERMLDAMRSVVVGESRSLDVVSAEPVTPPEISGVIFDKLRSRAVALASGMRVHPTSAAKVVFGQITSDVDPTWVAAGEVIPEGAPGLAALEAKPKKLAHRVVVDNEVLDDGPGVQDLLDNHLSTMLGLKLDRSIFEGNPASDADSIRGLKFQSGVQDLLVATNGAQLTNYDVFLRAAAMLRAANVPGPYAIATHSNVLTGLELLKRETGSNEQLGAPANLPPFYVTSQLSTNEAAGTSNDTMSAYVYAPSQIVVVDRQQAEVLLDRSRLFHQDQSEVRAKLRVDLLLPNPAAVVRVRGIKP